MIVIKDLNLICTTGSSTRFFVDGIYEKEGDIYLNFVHGRSNGILDILIKDKLYYIYPDILRQTIYEQTNFYIPEYQKVWIQPCFPKQVLERYAYELEQNNIYLYTGNWDTETAQFMSVKGKLFRLVGTEPIYKDKKKINILVLNNMDQKKEGIINIIKKKLGLHENFIWDNSKLFTK